MKTERHAQITRLISQYDIETQEELAEKRHNYELVKCDSNVICVDDKMAGVGSAACGPQLAEKYRLPLPKWNAEFHIRLS